MIGIVRRRLADWQFKKLERLINLLRARLSATGSFSAGSSLARDHIALADEHFAEAAAALGYRKFDQAMFACQKGLVQAGAAELLIRYGATIEAGMNKLALATKHRQVSEDEELVSFLASSLAQMKTIIEYTNCTVSSRAQQFLDSAMDYYNDALAALKNENALSTTRGSQAGLVQLCLASNIIRFDNELICLPALPGITNPMLASPLRRLDEMIAAIATVRSELNRSEPDVQALVRPHYEQAVQSYNRAIQALSKNDVTKAQSLIGAGLGELESAHGLLGSSGYTDISLTTPVAGAISSSWEPLVHIEPALADILNLLPQVDQRKQEQVRNYVSSIGANYSQAVKQYEAGNRSQALNLATTALLELDKLQSLCGAVQRLAITSADPAQPAADPKRN